MSAAPPFKALVGRKQNTHLHTDDKRRIARESSGIVTWGPRTVIKLMSLRSKQHTELNPTVQRPQGQGKGVRRSFQMNPYAGDRNWDTEPCCLR